MSIDFKQLHDDQWIVRTALDSDDCEAWEAWDRILSVLELFEPKIEIAGLSETDS